MDRVISIGSELGLADESISWDEDFNIKDFDVIFFNILELPVFDGEPLTNIKRDINIPKKANIRKATQAGSDMFFILPSDETARLTSTPHQPFSYLSLLPFNLELKFEEGRSLGSVDEGWNWYFSNRFKWKWIIMSENYKDSDEVVGDKKGELVFQDTILAKNRVDEALSIKLTAGEVVSKNLGNMEMKDINWWDGRIYVLLLIGNYKYPQFAEEILHNVYDLDLHTETDDTPEWLSEYTLPDEQEILDEISELRNELETKLSQLKGVQKYKELLYETGTTLEETVHKTFRDMGFDVEDEKSGRRDGSVQLTDERMILEIHGTTSGVSLNKCRQLDDWVERAIADGENDANGLLVVNPMRKKDPSERRDAIPDNVIDYMEGRGYKILTTTELLKLVKAEKENVLDKDAIEERLTDSTIVEIDEVELD